MNANSPVQLNYSLLKADPDSLEVKNCLHSAFGVDSLGLIIITDLPSDFPALREKTLRFSNMFGRLSPEDRDTCADPSSSYFFGWSEGKETMDSGQPDIAKGSFYFNPDDKVQFTAEESSKWPMYFKRNQWPSESKYPQLLGYRECMLQMTSLMREIGVVLAKACSQFANDHLDMAQIVQSSRTCKARLLHYFPPPSVTSDNGDDWCGWHTDHSALTALLSAQYYKDGLAVDCPDQSSGLYIQHKAGQEAVKINIPANAIAFQVGEALEAASNHRLRSVLHSVRSSKISGYSRETLALFLQPDVYVKLGDTFDSASFGDISLRRVKDHYFS